MKTEKQRKKWKENTLNFLCSHQWLLECMQFITKCDTITEQ